MAESAKKSGRFSDPGTFSQIFSAFSQRPSGCVGVYSQHTALAELARGGSLEAELEFGRQPLWFYDIRIS